MLRSIQSICAIEHIYLPQAFLNKWIVLRNKGNTVNSINTIRISSKIIIYDNMTCLIQKEIPCLWYAYFKSKNTGRGGVWRNCGNVHLAWSYNN